MAQIARAAFVTVLVFLAGSLAQRTYAQKARLLPGTRPSVLSTIQGNALSPSDAPMPFVTVRLRNVRTGQIVETTMSDKTGVFAFRGLDPGSYIVEMMNSNQTVQAASQILNVNAAEAVSAVVKIPFRVPPIGGLLGHSAPSAAAVLSAASASGVLATAVTGQPVSPNQ